MNQFPVLLIHIRSCIVLISQKYTDARLFSTRNIIGVNSRYDWLTALLLVPNEKNPKITGWQLKRAK